MMIFYTCVGPHSSDWGILLAMSSAQCWSPVTNITKLALPLLTDLWAKPSNLSLCSGTSPHISYFTPDQSELSPNLSMESRKVSVFPSQLWESCAQ